MPRRKEARLRATVLALGLAILGSAPGIRATVVPLLGLDDMLLMSDLIVEATVVSVESRWSENGNTIYTYVTFGDSAAVFGALTEAPLTLRFEGGEIAGYQVVTAGIPAFVAGDRELLMIKDMGKGVSPVVGIFQGRFRILAGNVHDYGGRPVLEVENNRLVKLGDSAADVAVSNSPDISQGTVDDLVYEYREGIEDSPEMSAAPEVEAPPARAGSQEPATSEPAGVLPPPVEAVLPGVWTVQTSPTQQLTRYLDPAEDTGERLSAVEFSDYIRRRLAELGRSR